ncbi:MAG: hypothetical protein ABI770_02255 [Sphingomicrobium sp.]
MTTAPRPLQSGTPANCQRTTSYYAYRSSQPLTPRRLTELPPANASSAVYRQIGGCEAPIIVKYRVGRR